jgi:uncharacterized membrane protein YesL
MKSFLLIPLVVFALVALAWSALAAAGVRILPLEPATAAIAGSAAGLVGLFPLLKSRKLDLTSVMQMALVGTVLHLLATGAIAAAAVASHLVQARFSFVFWLLGAYWISLIALVVQLRKLMLTHIGAAGPEH